MPNRIIRSGFLDSEAIDKLTDAAECFYHRLLLAADDAGRIDGRLEVLRARLFPLDSSRRVSDVEKLLRECTGQSLVVAYVWGGKPFLQVTRWQRCGNATTSKCPDRAGSHRIEYVQRDTADGLKDFVTSSLVPHADGMPMGSVPHPTRLEYVDVDGNEVENGDGDVGGATAPDHAALFKKLWNELPEPFPKVRDWTDGRKKTLRLRLSSETWVHNYAAALERMKASDFCCGQSQRGSWVADVDFFLRADTVTKIMEGKYDNRSSAQTTTARFREVKNHKAQHPLADLLGPNLDGRG